MGEGVAVKIVVSSINFEIKRKGKNLMPTFEEIPGLEKGGDKEIKMFVNDPNIIPLREGNFEIDFDSKQQIEIQYENLLGNKFRTLVEGGTKECKLINFEKIS